MNIFALDEAPEQAAAWHCDAHVIKMILETAQLLSTAHHVTTPLNAYPIYRQTHTNHPCAVWVRQSQANYIWLAQLGQALCDEYTFRYGKVHKTQSVLDWLQSNTPPSSGVVLTPFALAMPEELRDIGHPIQSYRNYYQTKRGGRLGTWKNRQAPDWWNHDDR